MQAKELKSKYTGVSSADSLRTRAGRSSRLGGIATSSRYRDEDEDDDIYASSTS